MPKKLLFNNVNSEMIDENWKDIEFDSTATIGYFKEREVLINGYLPPINTVIGTFLFITDKFSVTFSHKRLETGTSTSLSISGFEPNMEYLAKIILTGSSEISIIISNFETGEPFSTKTISNVKTYFAIMGIFYATSVKLKI